MFVRVRACLCLFDASICFSCISPHHVDHVEECSIVETWSVFVSCVRKSDGLIVLYLEIMVKGK